MSHGEVTADADTRPDPTRMSIMNYEREYLGTSRDHDAATSESAFRSQVTSNIHMVSCMVGEF